MQHLPKKVKSKTWLSWCMKSFINSGDSTSHIYRKHTYVLRPSHPKFVAVPNNIWSESDLSKHLFDPLLTFIDERQKCRIAKDSSSVAPAAVPKSIIQHNSFSENVTDYELIAQTGSKVKLKKWKTQDEEQDGMKLWCTSIVRNQTLSLSYSTEPGGTIRWRANSTDC